MRKTSHAKVNSEKFTGYSFDFKNFLRGSVTTWNVLIAIKALLLNSKDHQRDSRRRLSLFLSFIIFFFLYGTRFAKNFGTTARDSSPQKNNLTQYFGGEKNQKTKKIYS